MTDARDDFAIPVVYEHWRGEEWIEGGRRCRHLPAGCVFEVRNVRVNGELVQEADLREGSATPVLFELAKRHYLVFGRVNPDLQPPGNPWA